MRSLLTILIFGSILAATPPQGNSKGRGRSGELPAQEATKPGGPIKSSGPLFTDVEVRLIRDWFSKPANLKGLPPGLAKRETLPPGLEKQLQKNGTLPQGLQKKIQPLPPDLEVHLPKLPDGIRRVVISASVILMDSKSGRIFDILAKVF